MKYSNRPGRPRSTAPTERGQLIIAFYRGGHTMRETAAQCHCSLENVRQTLRRWAPDVIRARYVGKRQQGIAA